MAEDGEGGQPQTEEDAVAPGGDTAGSSPEPDGDEYGAEPDENDQVMPLASDDKPQGGAGGGAGDAGKSLPKGPSGVDDRLVKVKGLDKQQLCIDLLMVGCVQSFVDLFYITHRKSASTENPMDQTETKDVDIPEATLIFLKETLETAETARRSKNYQHCFESYNVLAEYFEKVPDLKSAMYFYQRCADVATEVDALESISKANLNLGTCEEKGNNWQNAMQFHERALTIATSADSLPLQIKAASRLTYVYQVLAEKCEKEGRDADATQFYERCLSCAQLSKDAVLEGTACHKLGLSKYKTGHYEPAIDLQKQYLEICRMHDDRIGESSARAALAHAYEAVGNAQEAIKQLENLLNVASEAGELQAQASACLNLGILYNGRADHEKSVELLEQHFDLARQLGDRKLIDSARVVLGMVRGNGKLKAYIGLVNNDLDKLLKWKSKRMTLEAS
jgi:tetratricopeptide (TPR) repeat protein